MSRGLDRLVVLLQQAGLARLARHVPGAVRTVPRAADRTARHIRPTPSAALVGLAWLAALLPACVADPRPTQHAALPAATSAARPALPVDRFDGRYAGTLVMNADRTRTCPAAPRQERLLTVQGGRGTFEIDPAIRQILTGSVDREGALRLVDRVDRTIATEGIFVDESFLGEHRNGLCSYAVRLRRRE